MKIEQLDISTKLYNQLKLHNINHIEDMRKITEKMLYIDGEILEDVV